MGTCHNEGNRSRNRFIRKNSNNKFKYSKSIENKENVKEKNKLKFNENKAIILEKNLFSEINNLKKIKISDENNNYGKNIRKYKRNDLPVKIIQKSNSMNINNDLAKIEKLLNLKNKNNLSNECLYIINEESENVKKIYSNDKEYYQNIKINLNNRIKLSNVLLSLSERNWYNELNDLNELLMKTRDKLDLKIFDSYILKIVKIKGFKWKGLYIKIIDGDKNKNIIHEIKALNYYFFDYLQIIDKYQFKKDNQLSNLIIFPLINYSNINGKIMIASALINLDKNSINQNKEIINKNNGIIKLFSDLNNSILSNNITKEQTNENINDDNNLINTMGKKFYVNDLIISKLFYNLNESHFLKIKNDKYIIFNLQKLIPDLFQINFDFIQKINFYSKIKNKRIFYSLNYDNKNKINIHQDLSKYKNPKEILTNLYYMNYSSPIKTKDIIISNVYFRILYQKEIQVLDDIRNNSAFSKNFVDNLFNYNYINKNISIKTLIKEPYAIIYDLIEPIKLKYSLIKSNKNYVFNEKKNEDNKIIDNTNNKNDIANNLLNEKEKDNSISIRPFYLESNYLSFFMSWCKSLSQNSFNIKSYSDLKKYMNKHGIMSNLRFFALVIIDNEEITDIIKISLLVKAIKFSFHKENRSNNLNLNYNEEGLRYKLFKYINSILYPTELLPKEHSIFDSIFRELAFFSNFLFLKLKLIDYYLNLGLLSLGDIKDQNIKIDASYSSFKDEKMKVVSEKLDGFNSPENFLIHIISIARKKPFLFLSELEHKLNFIINPFIKFKSSLSIESMKNQLNVNHININYTCKTFSYIKSNELSGLILSKIITRYNSYELGGSNFFNKIVMIENELRNKNKEIDIHSKEDEKDSNDNYIMPKMTSFPPSIGDSSPNFPDLFMISHDINLNKTYQENITINSELSKEYTADNNQSIFFRESNKDKVRDNNIKQKNKLTSNQTKKDSEDNSYDDENIEWDDIKNEFSLELPSICYKMNYISNKRDNNNNKNNNLSLYKNLSNIYNLINPKIIIEWGEILEEMFSKVYSCNGNIEHTLLYSLFYLFIYYFFFEKKRKECNIIIKKIYYLYHKGGYLLSLNDLIIINLFESLLNNDYIKSEENFSKTIMLIFLAYGEPRGRNNDSHGILEFPIWNICRKLIKFEQITLIENFREMFHTLDYFEWRKSLLRGKFKLYEQNNIIDYFENIMNNIDEILLINNLSNHNIKNKDNDDSRSDENTLSEKIFDEKFLELNIINHFNFPKLTDFRDKINNIFEKKEFILYFMKQIKSLFLGNKILLDQNYINNEISNEIFNHDQENNFQNNIMPIRRSIRSSIINDINLKNYKEILNKNNNYRYNGIIKERLNNRDINSNISNSKNNNKNNILSKNNKQLKRPASGISSKYSNLRVNLFSHFLYKELSEKLSYIHNMPSGVVFSFGNNKYHETSHDNLNKLTLPRIIYKLKNEYVNKIYSGWEYNIILNKQGEIFSFGHNNNFQCGVPKINEKEIISNPINISKINGNIKALSAACGNEHTLILKDDNSVYGFGNNEEGELGLEDKNIKTYKLNKINFGKYSNEITQISAGTVHNLALTKDGRVFAWGSSQGGQLGLSEDYLLNKQGFKETLFLYEPTMVHINKNLKKYNKNSKNNLNSQVDIDENDDEFIVKVSCGEAHSLALSSKGDVYSWGFGSNGQLGLGFCEDSFEPGLASQMSRRFTPQYIKSLEDTSIRDIQSGKTFTMFISERRQVLACGVNDLSQLGLNKHIHLRKNENLCYDVVWPTILDYLVDKKVQRLACGEGHCLAIVNYPENMRSVWSWGNNTFGQLGHGSWVKKCLPKPINFLLGFNNDKIQFEEISCGGFHSLCLTKYKENLNWIDDDFQKIVEAINKNDN